MTRPKRGTHYNRRSAIDTAQRAREDRAAARGLPDELAYLADVPTETLRSTARAGDPGPRGGIGERFARRLVGLDRCDCRTVQEHAERHEATP